MNPCEKKTVIDQNGNGGGYKSSHPSYYKRGGRVLDPEQIEPSTHKNYAESFSHSIKQCGDPVRYLKKLEAAYKETKKALDRDIKRYRDIVSTTPEAYKTSPVWPDPVANFCTDISLKHNHILWGRSKLEWIRQEAEKTRQTAGFQMDMFGREI